MENVKATVKGMYEEIFRRINNVIPYESENDAVEEIANTQMMLNEVNSIFKSNQNMFYEEESLKYEHYYVLAGGCFKFFESFNQLKKAVDNHSAEDIPLLNSVIDELDDFIEDLAKERIVKERIENFLISSKATIEYYRSLVKTSTYKI